MKKLYYKLGDLVSKTWLFDKGYLYGLYVWLMRKSYIHKRDDMDDVIVEEKDGLTIEQLYLLARSEGIHKKVLYVKIRDISTNQSMFTRNVTALGKGWTKTSCILTLHRILPGDSNNGNGCINGGEIK